MPRRWTQALRFLLTPLLEAKLTQETTAHWVEALNARGIPSGDVLSLEAALISEQAKHRRVIEDVETPGVGVIKIFNMTAKFSKTPAEITSPPPRLSEHTAEILSGLGYTESDVKVLKEKKAI